MKTIQLSEAAIIEIENLFKDRINYLKGKCKQSEEHFIANAYGTELNRVNQYFTEFNTEVEGGH